MREAQSFDFQQDLKDQKYILDFWADWCMPCKALAPTLESLEKETGIPIYKVNIDDQELLTSKYAVRSIPYILFMNGEDVVEAIVGAVAKPKLLDAAERLKRVN